MMLTIALAMGMANTFFVIVVMLLVFDCNRSYRRLNEEIQFLHRADEDTRTELQFTMRLVQQKILRGPKQRKGTLK